MHPSTISTKKIIVGNHCTPVQLFVESNAGGQCREVESARCDHISTAEASAILETSASTQELNSVHNSTSTQVHECTSTSTLNVRSLQFVWWINVYKSNQCILYTSVFNCKTAVLDWNQRLLTYLNVSVY